MLPELFRIPYFDIPINSFGVMLVTGLLLAMWVSMRLARRYGLDPELFANAAVWAILSGIVGARLSHVLENLDQYTDPHHTFRENLWDAINIHSGGLTYYGGFILAFPVLIWYAKKHKIPIRRGMDIIAPGLMIALGIGRIGCFLNGCCYGATCNVPWALHYPYHSIPYTEEFYQHKVNPPVELLHDVDPTHARLLDWKEIGTNPTLLATARAQRSLPLHPAQLYSTFTALLIAGIILAFLTLNRPPGQAFALMMIIEGIARYVLELVRAEPPVIGHMSLSMILGILICAGGVVLWFVFGARSESVTPPLAAQPA